MTAYSSFISELERMWDVDGFFYQLRQGVFDPEGYERLRSLLAELQLDDQNESIHRRLVALLWFIPLFMSWQRDRIVEAGSDVSRYEEAFDTILNHLYRILGVP